LGNGAALNSTSPVTVTGLSGVLAISAGMEHTCALMSDGTLQCWGGNFIGQLGNGVNINSAVPVQVRF
jgi:alpha-tubulin suppressor-like RCC1 family protein